MNNLKKMWKSFFLKAPHKDSNVIPVEVSGSKVIAVDNDESELYTLVDTLGKLNIGCIPVKYGSGEEINNRYTNVRIAFFDINLESNINEGSKLYSIISDGLKKILDKNNGPYALIFWTQHKNEIQNIKKYIEEREKEQIPSPMIVDCIDKIHMGDVKKLEEELERILTNNDLSILLDLENKAQQAAAYTINSIFKIIPSSDKWGDSLSFDENSTKFFSKIATDSIGYEHAKIDPKKGIQNALLPILEHNLKELEFSDAWNRKLDISSKSKSNIVFPDDRQAGQLNSIFHIVTSNGIDKDQRGVVLHANVSDEDFQKIFGCKKKELLQSFLPFDQEKVSKEERNTIRAEAEFIFIEVSASCDYAQNSPRMKKYILGLKYKLIPKEFLEVKRRQNCVYQLPVFTGSNDEDFIIAVNFRYVLGLNGDEKILGEGLFSLSESLINQIGNKYANYISRIGIISFTNDK